MARAFWSATAEQLVSVVDAVVANGGKADASLVARFADVPQDRAEDALQLAADLGLLSEQGGSYEATSPLCRFLVTPEQLQRAAVVRVLLESYEPFLTFRERMIVTTVDAAAEQTRTLLDLNAHREEIKDTLVSLGTFSQALIVKGGGQYDAGPMGPHPLQALVEACADQVAAEVRVRQQLGPDALLVVSRDDVIVPLSDAFIQARENARAAVVVAGNAVESFLQARAAVANVNVQQANGINAKVDRYLAAGVLPTKIGFVGKYLGHVRNAADHGVDPDVGAAWGIRPETGIEYVFVACSFIAAAHARMSGRPLEI
jgi:hypothetical protein